VSDIGIDAFRQKLGIGSQLTNRNQNKGGFLRVDSRDNIINSNSNSRSKPRDLDLKENSDDTSNPSRNNHNNDTSNYRKNNYNNDTSSPSRNNYNLNLRDNEDKNTYNN